MLLYKSVLNNYCNFYSIKLSFNKLLLQELRKNNTFKLRKKLSRLLAICIKPTLRLLNNYLN